MDCEYLIRHYAGERPNRLLIERCSLTGRGCLMDPPDHYRMCARRDWALSYQSKHPAPDPESHLDGQLPATLDR